jgi:Methyltransferase small domain
MWERITLCATSKVLRGCRRVADEGLCYNTRVLQSLTTEESQEFRDFLHDSGYTAQTLRTRFGHSEIPQLHLLKLYLVGIPLEPNRLNILLRWFWIGLPVESATAREFIPEHMIELFLKCGVLTAEAGCLAAPVRISPFADLVILSDHAVARTGTLRSDTVLWPNPSSLLGYHLAMRSPVGRTLDLGTGNGILALTAASHSGTVVATDLNARARYFCMFNASLNGVTNVEFREGNAFEPVRGERFDLILANPPFFVTPSVRRVYSDNSMDLDGFCRTLTRQAPEYLNENGYSQMLVEWVQVKGQPWRERLEEWFAGLGCDAWVMVSYMRSSADYAMIRVQEDRDEVTNAEDQAALTNTWQHYFESNQVEAIYGGMIVLRRREGRNWIRIEELHAKPVRPFGDFLRRVFESRDYLETHSDEELLAACPSLPASARLKKQFEISPEGWKLTGIDLQLGEGLPYSLALQPQVAEFVALCDGKRTLGEIADMTAAALSMDPALLRRESCGIIRQVADRGMVLI